ncbi:MAG: hypothetical protein KatS3mg008_0622 [Acidimicrobiales bacterium]|nr:MAG: hypothetical protein KatS3mg008_0622 [Acidimicrobiales bacterium]
MGRCERHQGREVVAHCRSCGAPCCDECVVYLMGTQTAPWCVECSLALAEVGDALSSAQ